jgi:dUTP pyrophosphatase
MKVKIKKLTKSAVIPSYAKEGDAGLDLVATSKTTDEYGNIVYGTGLAVEIPKGYVGLLFPRSSNAKTNLYLTNSVGVIDSGYRGEIMVKYKCMCNVFPYINYWWQKKVLKRKEVNIGTVCLTQNAYNMGDRIGQLVIIKLPTIELVETESLSETDRGNAGFGSTGK